jgi:putative transposase
MTVGNNPTDRSKLGTKRHILTDKNGIPLSTVISSASTHDIKAVTDVIDNSVINRTSKLFYTKKKTRRTYYHLCLDKAYSSKSTENEIIRRGYVPHIQHKRKRGQRKELITYQHKHQTIKNKRWVVERTNSWHNRFRKLFTRYEKKAENYLGLVQLSSSIIIYRKIILG